ncbi:MAG: aminotransferase class V-fold PLP-dependent enzyme [Lachnospiraceae bacterium]|jgi:arginine/lysine/ornithine decarboxylase|nr:aminotransferase class V-fold PLP-dependent enzyme [Lachnospiraceae bacterium]
MESILEKLNNYANDGYLPMHMPGHKRNTELFGKSLPFSIDVTEIPEFGDLHHGTDDCIKIAQERAARIFGADKSFFLINGSTVGLISAILASTRPGQKILMARNSHICVYHAIELGKLFPVYVYPDVYSGQIKEEDVRKALHKDKDIVAIVIASVTYEGIVSDVRNIAKAAHERGIVLIVDEAHGAHFGFDSYFPENANRLGADIVVHSLHKTLPSLTQTALLHCNGDLVDAKRVKESLHRLQSSSPSYVLMSSIDNCLKILEERGELFKEYAINLKNIRKRLGEINGNIIEKKHCAPEAHIGCEADACTKIESISDPSKIVINCMGFGLSGFETAKILHDKYKIQVEMATAREIIALTSIGDTSKALQRFAAAIEEINNSYKGRKYSEEKEVFGGEIYRKNDEGNAPVARYTAWQVFDEAKKGEIIRLPIMEAIGYICAEYIYAYPPGRPLIVPGEELTKESMKEIESVFRNIEYESKNYESKRTKRIKEKEIEEKETEKKETAKKTEEIRMIEVWILE